MSRIIPMFVRLPLRYEEEGEWTVAICDLLKVSTQGKNRADAKDRIQKELELFILASYTNNTLEEVLSDCGFSRTTIPARGLGIFIDGVPGEDLVEVKVPPAFMVGHADGNAGVS